MLCLPKRQGNMKQNKMMANYICHSGKLVFDHFVPEIEKSFISILSETKMAVILHQNHSIEYNAFKQFYDDV